MTAARIRADYDRLQQVAATIQQQVEATKHTLAAIQRSKDVLQSGDWVGQGASAFYREMDDNLLPTFQRLINALDSAANSTSQISAIMQDAENQAAQVLKGPGSGSSAAGGLRAMGGAAGPGAAAAGGILAMGGSAGAGSAAGAGAGSAAGAGPAAGSGAGPSAPAPAAKTATQTMLSELDAKAAGVTTLAARSPTLMKQLNALQDAKWPIKLMARPTGVAASTGSQTFFHPHTIEIYIDDGQGAEAYVQRMAHEAAIAMDDPHLEQPSKALTCPAFIAANVPKLLTSEAKAIFNEQTVRSEIQKNGGSDIGLSETDKDSWGDYQKTYDDYQKNHNFDAAIAQTQADYTADGQIRKGYEKDLQKEWDTFKLTGDPGRW